MIIKPTSPVEVIPNYNYLNEPKDRIWKNNRKLYQIIQEI